MKPFYNKNYTEHKLTIGDADFTYFSTNNMIAESQNNISPIHTHDFIEFFYVIHGEVHIHTESEKYVFYEGDCALISGNLAHTSEICSDSQRIAISLFVKKSKQKSEPKYYDIFEDAFKNNIYTFRNFVGSHAFKRLAGYYYSDFADKEELILSCLHEITVLVKTSITSDKPILSTEKLFDDTSYRKYIIDEYFNAQYEGKSLSKLADILHLSTQQTQRIIKKTYGQTYRERMIYAKMRYAKNLLATTDTSVSKIAQMVGYTCTHSFFDTFKNEFGITPNEYRKDKKISL